jgi:hypothetical protein
LTVPISCLAAMNHSSTVDAGDREPPTQDSGNVHYYLGRDEHHFKECNNGIPLRRKEGPVSRETGPSLKNASFQILAQELP